jgi:hypothetical protein
VLELVQLAKVRRCKSVGSPSLLCLWPLVGLELSGAVLCEYQRGKDESLDHVALPFWTYLQPCTVL